VGRPACRAGDAVQVLLEQGGQGMVMQHPTGKRRLGDLLPTPRRRRPPGNVLLDGFEFDAPTDKPDQARDGGRFPMQPSTGSSEAYNRRPGRPMRAGWRPLLMAIVCAHGPRRRSPGWTAAD